MIDLFPTVTELAGIKQPEAIRGIRQDALHRTSWAYSFNDKAAASKHTQQYYCIFGNRAIYKDGWKASAAHHPNSLKLFTFAGEPTTTVANDPENEVWELYNLNEDFNERNDLAKKHPEKLKELKALFDSEAVKYNIYPLIDMEHATSRYKEQQEQWKKSQGENAISLFIDSPRVLNPWRVE